VGSFSAYSYEPVHGVFVADVDNGNAIYSYNADKQTQPASLTKMMTLLLTFRELQKGTIKWDTMIKVSRHAADQSPTKLGLKAGASISVRNAVLSLITKSANDMAVALAEYLGGTEANFVKKMNEEAKRLGMMSTLFVNPSGWKNTKQRTTARDMFKLSKALLKEYPKYYSLFSTKIFNYEKQHLANHNNLLGRHVMGTPNGTGYFVVDGIKTGYVAASGFNLAASATNGKIRLIAVVLGGKTARQRDAQMNLLLQKGFLRAEAKLKKGQQKIVAVDDSNTAYLEHIGANAFDNNLSQLPSIKIQKAKNKNTKSHLILATKKNVKLQKKLLNRLNKNHSKKHKRK